MAKVVLEIEDKEERMDSGCLFDILQEATNHGTVTKAQYVLNDGHVNDLMHMLEGMRPDRGSADDST